MKTLVRWDPFSEFRGLRRAMDRGVFEFYGPTVWRNAETSLTFPVDLSETDGQVVVKAALPGIQPEDVDISVIDGVLTIEGETKSEEKSEAENYHRREIRYGAFSRAITLPTEVDDARAEAEFRDGVLTVTLPKAEEARPKQIKVKAVAGKSNGSKSS
jgi:HSP20 family protein